MIADYKTFLKFIKGNCPEEIKEGVYKAIGLISNMEEVVHIVEEVVHGEVDELYEICKDADRFFCGYINNALFKKRDFDVYYDFVLSSRYLELIEKAANMLLEVRYKDTNIRATAKLNKSPKEEIDFRNVEDVTVCVEFTSAYNEDLGVRIDIHPDCIFNIGHLSGKAHQARKFKELDESTLTSIMEDKKVQDNWKKGDSISISELPNNVSTM